ncbi:MAG: hypothetical protein ABF932_03650 [Gluconobacter potus]|uniref:Uncharacterized protein n=1 Tax=Gluconobacter potus TaxID=2724927 RepID=A0ABR9YJ30_9PROT|nr:MULTISPECIES: hypothetical protein [Gluconobacter]MBF0863228.1 hypothetical protein [Gluconobacter sp. R71656]MBF0867382.1 hypothetical protein [Gluconobacter sp. R75628]MBF0873820.1 hypothetical protein [Gluconobacter sp. R75629]MBF0881804.1 hypothetical protein [Gluconobacter potus]
MDADLEQYLEAGLGRLQDDASACPWMNGLEKKVSSAARETEALVSDLMVDQPLFWLLTSFFIGILLGKGLFRKS